MNVEETKEVYYYLYCEHCKFYDKSKENSDECNDCLNHPYNYNSHKPTRFISKDSSYEATKS